MSARLFTVFFSCLALSNGQTAQDGSCDPTISAVTGFDAASYLGLWYEYARSLAAFEKDGKCVTAEYSRNADGSIKVINTMYNATSHTISDIEGYATFIKDPSVAKLAVKFPSSPFPGSYWVLDTDYHSYAAVYGCNNVKRNSYINMWILTREKEPEQETLKKAYAAFGNFDLNTSLLKPTDQSHC